MPSERPLPLPFALRPGEFFVSLGSATLQPGAPVSMTRTFGPDGATAPDAPALSPDPLPATYSATPNDGTPDGGKLALMNDLMHALPGGATTTLWFDERPPEVQHHDAATLADDLVTLNGESPATPPLAAVVAATMKQE